MSKYLDGKVLQQRNKEMESLVHCPECKFYYAPVCTFYKFLPMTSRHGYCYHGIKGKYEGQTPIVKGFDDAVNTETHIEFSKYMNLPEEDNND